MTPGKGSWTKKQKDLAVPVYLPHAASAGKDLRTWVPHTAEKDPTILLGSGAACIVALPVGDSHYGCSACTQEFVWILFTRDVWHRPVLTGLLDFQILNR